MRCAKCRRLIYRGEDYYDIAGDCVCIEDVLSYLNLNYKVKKGLWDIDGERVEEDDLNMWLIDHLKTNEDDDEENYNFRDEPEYWKD